MLTVLKSDSERARVRNGGESTGCRDFLSRMPLADDGLQF